MRVEVGWAAYNRAAYNVLWLQTAEDAPVEYMDELIDLVANWDSDVNSVLRSQDSTLETVKILGCGAAPNAVVSRSQIGQGGIVSPDVEQMIASNLSPRLELLTAFRLPRRRRLYLTGYVPGLGLGPIGESDALVLNEFTAEAIEGSWSVLLSALRDSDGYPAGSRVSWVCPERLPTRGEPHVWDALPVQSVRVDRHWIGTRVRRGVRY